MALEGPPRRCVNNLVQDFFFVSKRVDILGMFQEVIITWLVNVFFNLLINGVFVGVK